MAINLPHLLVVAVVLLVIQPLVQSRSIKESFKSLQNLEESHKEQTVKGLHEIKHYLNRFGYLNYNQTDDVESEEFDKVLENAVKTYQKNFHLNVTGKLDSNTIKHMTIPRCGVPDNNIGLQFAFFDGKPHWSKTQLTYTFDSSVNGNTLTLLRSACSQAFSEWEKVSHFRFKENPNNSPSSDIVIGFYRGEHGDDAPFDGPGNILAHAAAPVDGILHFDADEQWSNTPTSVQIDTIGVALHEIGHVLGLAHSSNPDAIMYPTVKPGIAKRVPQPDDVQGIRALYN